MFDHIPVFKPINESTSSEIAYSKKDNKIIAKLGKFTFIASSDVEDEEMLREPFGKKSLTDEEFVGICFHLIQQTGGKLLYDDKEVKSRDISQTSGEPVKRNSTISFGKQVMTFNQLLNN